MMVVYNMPMNHSFFMIRIMALELESERSALFTQLLCPPLPMVCRNSSERDERITNSHDLIYAMFGRLLMVPENNLQHCYPSAGFQGNWRLHILKGKHAFDLLDALVAQPNVVEFSQLYPLFCNYCREVIRILVGYDMASQVSPHMTENMAQSGYDGAGDIRFLSDPGRVSFSKYPSLVNQIIDHYMSVGLFWTPEVPEEFFQSIKKELVERKDYMYTLGKTMHLIRSFSGEILEVERGPKTEN